MNLWLLLAYAPGYPRPGGVDGEADGDFGYVFAPGALPKLLILAMLGTLVISLWWHYRPCDTCGEYRDQCRCKGRDY